MEEDVDLIRNTARPRIARYASTIASVLSCSVPNIKHLPRAVNELESKETKEAAPLKDSHITRSSENMFF